MKSWFRCQKNVIKKFFLWEECHFICLFIYFHRNLPCNKNASAKVAWIGFSFFIWWKILVGSFQILKKALFHSHRIWGTLEKQKQLHSGFEIVFLDHSLEKDDLFEMKIPRKILKYLQFWAMPHLYLMIALGYVDIDQGIYKVKMWNWSIFTRNSQLL